MRDRLLTRHFLRRFLENDLISPNADHHEILSVLLGAILALGLFVTFALSLKMMHPLQTPGRAAVVALDDRFFFIGASMLILALTAALCWDSLSLDSRDLAILGPLPVSYQEIRRAKVEAVVLLAVVVDLIVNGLPSVLYSLLMVGKLRISALGVLSLMLSQCASTLIAGAFGFAAVISVREICRAILGRLFDRISALLQAVVTVAVVAALVLLPASSAHSWLVSGRPSLYGPSLWFLGLQESVVGSVIDQAPRGELPGHLFDLEAEATALYRSLNGTFHALAERAIVASLLVFISAFVAYTWNNRRAPDLSSNRVHQRRWSGFVGTSVRRVIVRKSTAQAGFFFTLQVLWRSMPHRFSITTAVAIAVALVTAIMAGVPVARVSDSSEAPVGLFAIQGIVLGLVLVGFRHAIRVPAELRANWAFRLAWRGDIKGYMAGVRRAAFMALGIPVATAMLPLYLAVLGPRMSLMQLASSVLLALLLLELIFVQLDKLPFACSYVPQDNLTALAGIYVGAFLLGSYGLGWVERSLFASRDRAEIYLVVLVVLIIAAKGFNFWTHRHPIEVDFNELPPPPTQRLTLSG